MRFSIVSAVVCAVWVAGAIDEGAAAGADPSDEQSERTSRDAEQVAADLANPLAPITTVFGQYRAELGAGADGNVNHQLRLQPSFFFPLANQSAFLARTIVPFPIRTWPKDVGGLGDISIVPYYVPDITRSVFVGYGAALSLATATDETLGSGKWSAGPAVLFAKTGQPITVGALVQHVWSFAGDDERGDVSVTTTQPFSTYLLGGGWSVTVISEVSYNWNTDDSAWTVPVNLGVSKVLSFAGRFINLGVTGVYYVVGSALLPDAEVRVNATYVLR